MRRKLEDRPEDQWRGATPEQIADLRVWILQRRSEHRANVVAEWILALNADAETHLSRDEVEMNRHLLAEYGPPRVVPAAGTGPSASS